MPHEKTVNLCKTGIPGQGMDIAFTDFQSEQRQTATGEERRENDCLSEKIYEDFDEVTLTFFPRKDDYKY